MKNKIAVIGSINMDMVVNVPYMPRVGETILAEKFKTVPGGKGANQAYAAARFGGAVNMLGMVGQDEFGPPLLENLCSAGVNTAGIKTAPGIHTGLAFINVNAEGDNSIVVAAGANGAYTEGELENALDLIAECAIVLLQLEIPLPTVFRALGLAKERGKTVIFNPAPAPEPGQLGSGEMEKIDIITPNKSELEKLTKREIRSTEDLERGARELLEMGASTVIVTMGDLGAALVTPALFEIFPAHRVRVVDTTAAGDAFSAALAVMLAEGNSLAEAVAFANRAAALTVTREGAQTSIPSRAEVLGYVFD